MLQNALPLRLKDVENFTLSKTLHDTLSIDPTKRPRAEQLHKRFTTGAEDVVPSQIPQSSQVPRSVPISLSAIPEEGFFEGPPTSHVLVLERGGPKNKQLVHYWRDDSSPKLRFTWNRGQVISTDATSTASIIPFSSDLYESLVLEESTLIHYTCDCHDFNWKRGDIISDRATGPASFAKGNIHHIVILEGNNLVHFSRESNVWKRLGVISNRATGPGSIVASSTGNLDVLVLEGKHLFLYSWDTILWTRRQLVAMASHNGPDTFLQSTFISKLNIGNYELIVFNDGHLVHKWRDNSIPQTPWTTTAIITTSAIGPGVLLQTMGLGVLPGYLEVLVVEDPGNLVYYWRDHTEVGQPWYRGATISTEAVAVF